MDRHEAERRKQRENVKRECDPPLLFQATLFYVVTPSNIVIMNMPEQTEIILTYFMRLESLKSYNVFNSLGIIHYSLFGAVDSIFKYVGSPAYSYALVIRWFAEHTP